MRVDNDNILTDADMKRELRGYKPPKMGRLKIPKRNNLANPNKHCSAGMICPPLDLRSIKRSYSRS